MNSEVDKILRAQPLNPLEKPVIRERSDPQPVPANVDTSNAAHLAAQHSAIYFNQGDTPVADTDA